MNPLVEKMLNTTVSNDVETRFLEDLFEEEAKCESRHQNPENAYCSGGATHMVSYSCEPTRDKVCDASAKYTQRCRNNPDDVCRDCGLSCFECWTIRPI